MTNDAAAFHFPPDVFDALVDAVPLLVRSKSDVLTFFQGCGVNRDYLKTVKPRELVYEPSAATVFASTKLTT